jgi:hypothetical protein
MRVVRVAHEIGGGAVTDAPEFLALQQAANACHAHRQALEEARSDLSQRPLRRRIWIVSARTIGACSISLPTVTRASRTTWGIGSCPLRCSPWERKFPPSRRWIALIDWNNLAGCHPATNGWSFVVSATSSGMNTPIPSRNSFNGWSLRWRQLGGCQKYSGELTTEFKNS